MKTQTLKRVDMWSYSKFTGAVGIVMGLFLGILTTVFGFAASAGAPSTTVNFGASLGLFAVVLFPLIYGFFGLIGGIIGGFLINLALKICKGFTYFVDDANPIV